MSKKVRLAVIRDKWFNEPLQIKFPPLTDGDTSAPNTCDDFVCSSRLMAAFSTLHPSADATGMHKQKALEHDRMLNAERYGVDDPPALLKSLSRQFDQAPSGRIDATVLKRGFLLLNSLRSNSTQLAAQVPDNDDTSSVIRAAHLADAQALTEAQSLVQQLAEEIGIALPVNRRGQHNR